MRILTARRGYSAISQHLNLAGRNVRNHHFNRSLRRLSTEMVLHGYPAKVSPRLGAIVPVRQVSSLPRLIIRTFRLPIGLGAFGAGALAYIDHRIQEATNYTKGIFTEARDWISTAVEDTKATVSEINWPELPDMQRPAWMTNLGDRLKATFEQTTSQEESHHNNDHNKPPDHKPGPFAAVGAAVAGVMTSNDDKSEATKSGTSDQMMLLTLKMIEIRNLLSRVGQSAGCALPSIVVIGAQSSGKSSVLEAICGHEFLPKGSNMVTRRPIELTFINDRTLSHAIAQFPDIQGSPNIKDFTQVQKMLTELNLSVTREQGVSDEPIRLTVRSPTVPNLSLIDLPGYIQVQSDDQPEALDEKIQGLCNRYIKGTNNIILAISAADVDLANSTALRASRRVDPRGSRTIGVITKMDLVAPTLAADVLKSNKYPLRLGYIGVISKLPPKSVFPLIGSPDIAASVAKVEGEYFDKHEEFAGNKQIGMAALKTKLQEVLEKSMSEALDGAARSIRRDLDDTLYRFKVEYNDRALTPETYLASTLDQLKQHFSALSTQLGKKQLHGILKDALEFTSMDILSERYYSDNRVHELMNLSADDNYWSKKLADSTGNLTRIGIGKTATDLAERALVGEVEKILQHDLLRNSAFARSRVEEAVRDIIDSRRGQTIDQVENSIKPYKWEVEVEQREWDDSRQQALHMLDKEIRLVDEAYDNIAKAAGGARKLKQVMSALQALEKSDSSSEAFMYSGDLLEAGRRGRFCQDRSQLLKERRKFVNSKKCSSNRNDVACPEVFMAAVTEKLTGMAVLFLNIELLSEFYYHLPREIDDKLLHNLTPEEISRFAREDTQIRKHIELQERKELLELALSKIESIQTAKRLEAESGRDYREPKPRGRWSFSR